MFIGLGSKLFDFLVSICRLTVNSTPLNRDLGMPDERAWKRRLYGARGIMAMMVKYLTSTPEEKYLYVQFGATRTVFL